MRFHFPLPIRSLVGRNQHDNGQATVEAAFVIPLLLLALLFLIQPCILLYTYMVMQAAAAETCRVVATESLLEQNTNAVENYAKRRLASVPQQANFHVHDPTCTWVIYYEGDETSNGVLVEITNEVKPLPFFDFGLAALGMLNANGNFEIKASQSVTTKSQWVQNNPLGTNPEQWIGQWTDS